MTGKICLRAGLVAAEALSRCLHIKRNNLGRRDVPLIRIIEEEGFLTRPQADRVLEILEQVRKRTAGAVVSVAGEDDPRGDSRGAELPSDNPCPSPSPSPGFQDALLNGEPCLIRPFERQADLYVLKRGGDEFVVRMAPLDERHDGDRLASLTGRIRQLEEAGVPGLPPVTGILDWRAARHLVLPHATGNPLGRVTRRLRLDTSRALTITRRLCEVLVAAHRKGIYHGSLEIDKVYLGAGSGVTIVGFLDAVLEDQPPDASLRSWWGPFSLFKKDLVAVGQILMALLALEVPRHFRDEIDLIGVNPGLDPSLARLISRAVLPQPEASYRDLGSFLNELEELVRREEDRCHTPPTHRVESTSRGGLPVLRLGLLVAILGTVLALLLFLALRLT